MIDFSKLPARYWSMTTKMSYLQRRIIIYSIQYYEQSESCVSDKFYDGISYQLVAMMKKANEQEKKATTYWYAMYDFDGSTGFDIPSRLSKKDKEYLTNLATYIYGRWKHDTGGKYLK